MPYDTYFPKLVGDYNGSTPITKSWRYIVRCRLLERFSLEYILEQNLVDFGRI